MSAQENSFGAAWRFPSFGLSTAILLSYRRAFLFCSIDRKLHESQQAPPSMFVPLPRNHGGGTEVNREETLKSLFEFCAGTFVGLWFDATSLFIAMTLMCINHMIHAEFGLDSSVSHAAVQEQHTLLSILISGAPKHTPPSIYSPVHSGRCGCCVRGEGCLFEGERLFAEIPSQQSLELLLYRQQRPATVLIYFVFWCLAGLGYRALSYSSRRQIKLDRSFFFCSPRPS